MIQPTSISEITLPAAVQTFYRGKRKVWAYGNPAMLDRPLLGIISARQSEPDLASKSAEVVKQLACMKEVAFISGWHSSLEQEALRLLLSQEARVVFCLAKTLNQFKPSSEIEKRLLEGVGLLVSHCTPRAKRISREASIRRNELVMRLAAALLVFSAPEGSTSLNLARAAFKLQKPVFTLEHPMNRKLLDSGASIATFDAICTVVHEFRESG